MRRWPDVVGTPALAEAGADWFREIVGALHGSFDPGKRERMIREVFLLAPKKNSKRLDHADRWPVVELVEQMKELGQFGATVSPDYGGLGLPARTYAEAVMRISSVWMSLTWNVRQQ